MSKTISFFFGNSEYEITLASEQRYLKKNEKVINMFNVFLFYWFSRSNNTKQSYVCSTENDLAPKFGDDPRFLISRFL